MSRLGIDPTRVALGVRRAGVGMTFGLIQYVLASRALGAPGLHPAVPPHPSWHAERPEAGALSGVASPWAARRGRHSDCHRGALRSSRRGSRCRGVLLLLITVVFFGMSFHVGSWTPRGTGTAVGHLRLLSRRRHLLVGVRPGGIHVEPLCRSQHPQSIIRLEFSKQLVPVGERAVHHGIRADVRLAVGHGWAPEPASPTKFAIGLSASASASLVLVPAAIAATKSGALVSPLWLIASSISSHVRGTVPESRGPERHDQARAGARRRAR